MAYDNKRAFKRLLLADTPFPIAVSYKRARDR